MYAFMIQTATGKHTCSKSEASEQTTKANELPHTSGQNPYPGIKTKLG